MAAAAAVAAARWLLALAAAGQACACCWAVPRMLPGLQVAARLQQLGASHEEAKGASRHSSMHKRSQ